MMGYDHAGGGVWMWVFGGLLMAGFIVLIGLAVWAVLAATNRGSRGPITVESSIVEVGGRSRTRQLLDERYARGEMNTEEYTERMHTLGL